MVNVEGPFPAIYPDYGVRDPTFRKSSICVGFFAKLLVYSIESVAHLAKMSICLLRIKKYNFPFLEFRNTIK
jgi:hypothetical protein